MVLYLKIVKNKYVYNVYNSYFINKYLCSHQNMYIRAFKKNICIFVIVKLKIKMEI